MPGRSSKLKSKPVSTWLRIFISKSVSYIIKKLNEDWASKSLRNKNKIGMSNLSNRPWSSLYYNNVQREVENISGRKEKSSRPRQLIEVNKRDNGRTTCNYPQQLYMFLFSTATIDPVACLALSGAWLWWRVHQHGNNNY